MEGSDNLAIYNTKYVPSSGRDSAIVAAHNSRTMTAYSVPQKPKNQRQTTTVAKSKISGPAQYNIFTHINK